MVPSPLSGPTLFNVLRRNFGGVAMLQLTPTGLIAGGSASGTAAPDVSDAAFLSAPGTGG